jgi:hypothetical protein
VSHPTNRAERRASAQRCRGKRARRDRLSRRVNALLTGYKLRRELAELQADAA